MNESTTNRLFPVLLLLLIAAGAFFGLTPFLLPTQFAQLFGFVGVDVFMYRIAGAATFGYAVGLVLGYRASWPELRIGIAATAVFNLGSLVACALAISAGATPWVVYLITLASLVFAPACLYYYFRPPTNRDSATVDDRKIAPWITGLFVIGTLSALFFGLAALFPAGAFGHALGYPGMDDFIYRQGGAATLGAGIGGALVLMDRRWVATRIPTVMALTFNLLAAIAVVLDIAAGTAQPVAYLILGAAGLVTIGTALALFRNGR